MQSFKQELQQCTSVVKHGQEFYIIQVQKERFNIKMKLLILINYAT